MYDELIGRLRVNGELFQKYIPNAEGEILLQAADAIEQLSNAGSAYGRGWTLGYDAGRDENKPRWIPVTERLPEEHVFVLIRQKDDRMMVAERVDGNWWYRYFAYDVDRWDESEQGTITHWMPLPTEPQKEE